MIQQDQYKKYQEQSVMTLSPSELILLLYDEAIKSLKKAQIFLENKKINEVHNCIMKTENIYLYLIDNLDMKYPISNELLALYDYIYNRLIQANMKKDPEILNEVLNMTSELKVTWMEADKISRANNKTETKI